MAAHPIRKDYLARDVLEVVKKVKVASEGTSASALATIPSPVLVQAIRGLIPSRSP